MSYLVAFDYTNTGNKVLHKPIKFKLDGYLNEGTHF